MFSFSILVLHDDDEELLFHAVTWTRTPGRGGNANQHIPTKSREVQQGPRLPLGNGRGQKDAEVGTSPDVARRYTTSRNVRRQTAERAQVGEDGGSAGLLEAL